MRKYPRIPAPTGVNWGTTNTPPERILPLTQEYVTRDGHRVVGLKCEMHPPCCQGREVTFPLKGSIIRKGRPPEYCIWTLDGRSCVLQKMNVKMGRDLIPAENV